jgi:hypothetical protein
MGVRITKKILILTLLTLLIIVSGFPAQGQPNKQLELNLGGAQLTPMGDQSGSANAARQSASWSETPLSGQASSMGVASQGTPKSMALQLNINPGLNQSVGRSAVMQYSQYFRSTSNAPTNPITAPAKFNLQGQEPSMLYFGSSQKAVPYSQYQTYALTTGLNSLWIQGTSSWTQYAMVPFGTSLSLIGTSSTGGYGYLYEVYPDGTLITNSYYFYPYNQIGFYADKVGQHLLFFNINGQPSNIIVVDVAQYQPPSPPPIYNYAAVTVSSSWLRGYDVFVDGSYQATEGTTGEPAGEVTVDVTGNQYHTIAVSGSGFSFSDYKYFNAGWAYTLNV